MSLINWQEEKMSETANPIISTSPPTPALWLLWYNPDTERWNQCTYLDPQGQNPVWEELPIKAGGDADNINFVGTVSVDGDLGITGSKIIGGFKITFKKGLLVGFDPI